MPFFTEHDLLFVHIPKTGGTSIEQKFGIIDKEKTLIKESNVVCYEHGEYKIEGKEEIYAPQHYTPDIIESKYPKYYNKCKKFTVIRNPYERAISSYFMHEAGSHKEFDPDGFDWFWHQFPLLPRDHNLPQKRYFNNNIKYDYILKFENLAEEFALMANDFTFSPDIPHINKSNKGSALHISKIKRETLDYLNDYFSEDFEFLHYDKL